MLDYNLELSGNYSLGIGTITLLNGDYTFDFSANANTKEFSLNLNNNNLIIDSKNQPDLNLAYFNAGNGNHDISSNFNTSNNTATISYTNNNFVMDAEKESDGYKINGKYNDNDLSLIKSSSASNIKYIGNGIIGEIDNSTNSFISAEYSGTQVKLKEKKVYLDGNMIYDFSTNTGTIPIDYTNFYFPNLDISSLDFSGLDLSILDLGDINFSGLDFQNIDLSSIDFTGIDFTGVDLSSIDFSNINLDNIDLSSLNFTGYDFSGIDLSSIDFTGITIPNSQIPNINLTGINFSGIDLSNVNISNLDLTNMALNKLDFSGFDFTGIDLSSIDFTGFDFNNNTLSNANLTGFDLSSIDFTGLDFTAINLSSIDFSGISIPNERIPDINFTGYDFTGVNLTNVNISNIDLNGVNLSSLNLTGYDFSGIDLSSIDFTSIDINSLDLSGITNFDINTFNFTDFDFSGVDLSSIDFTGILFSDFDFSSIDFSGFDFTNIDLNNVSFDGIDISSLNLSGLDFTDFDFTGIDLSSIDFTDFDFSGINLSSINFSGLDLSNLDLSSIDFTGISISNMNYAGIDFTDFDFNNIDLSSVIFDGLDISSLNLLGIDLSAIDFSGSDLSSIDFSGLDLSNIDLSLLDFTGFDFSDVDLNGIDLSSLDITNIDLSNIDFSGLDLSSLDLSSIDFTGVDFSGLDLSNLDFSNIVLPDLSDLDWQHTEIIQDVTININLKQQEYTFSIIKGQDSIQLYTNDWTDNIVNVYFDGNFIKGSKNSNVYELEYNDISAEIITGNEASAIINNGVDYNLQLSSDEISGKYQEHEFNLSTSYEMEYHNNNTDIQYENNEFIFSNGDKKLEIGTDNFKAFYSEDKNIELSSQGLTVNYTDKNLSISNGEAIYTSGSDIYKAAENGLEVSKGDQAFELKSDKFYMAVANDKSINYLVSTQQLDVTYEDKSFSISPDQQVSYNDPNNSFSFLNDAISLTHDGKSVNFSEGEVNINLDTDKKLEISNGILDVTYLTNNIKLGSDALYFSDGTQSVDLSQNSLSLIKGDNNIYVNSNEFGLNIGAQNHLIVNKTNNNVDFKYNDIQATFNNNQALSFSDGQHSFTLGTSGLTMSDGDKTISVLSDAQGEQSLQMTSGTNAFEVSKNGLAINYNNQYFAINETEYLNVGIDAQHNLSLSGNGGKFVNGDTELIVGGDNNYLEIKDATRSIILSQDQSLTYIEGDYQGTLSSNLEVELSDGTRTIELFKPGHILSYQQDGYTFGIRGGIGVTPGIDVSNGTHTIFVEGEVNDFARVGIGSNDFGNIMFSCNSSKDLEASYEYGGRTITLSAGQQGLSVEDSEGMFSTEAELPDPVGTQTPELDGPQYLGNGITAEADGRIKGSASLYYNSADSHFIANAAVASAIPPCMSGSFGMEVMPGTFNFNIGSQQQKIIIEPLCVSSFYGEGYLQVQNSNIQMGLEFGWDVHASLDIGVAVISAYTNGVLGCSADIDLSPFALNEALIYASVSAGLTIDPFAGSEFTVAAATLSGQLRAQFNDEATNISGSLNGSVTILGISESFDMSFSNDF